MADTPVARLRAVERHLAWHAETEDPYQSVVLAADLEAALVAKPEDVERVAALIYADFPEEYTAAWDATWTGDDDWSRDMRRDQYLDAAKAALRAMGFTVPDAH